MTFECEGLASDTFEVMSFEGKERLSDLFSYRITLRSRDNDINHKSIVDSNITFSFSQHQRSRTVNGILRDFQALYKQNEYIVYRATLVPSLWKSSLFVVNDVYVNKTVPEIIESILEELGFTTLDYRLELSRTYESWPFRCQYNESYFNYLSRLFEREGIYYFFDSDADAEVLVITDNMSSHEDINNPDICFSQSRGLDNLQQDILLFDLKSHVKRLPKQVILRDYNDETPTVDIKGIASVDTDGIGDVNIFGQNITTIDEGEELAGIRAEEIIIQAQLFNGKSTVIDLQPGWQFNLADHFIDEFNTKHLVVGVTHFGQDPRFQNQSEQSSMGRNYYNRLSFADSTLQFRPGLNTQAKRIHGVFHAEIDAAGDGQYAEIDDEGRYKVKLPIDTQTRDAGSASCWVRMLQPVGGTQEGMHFPLRKGSRVLLSFIDGDPDRPIIAGAIPNSEQPSVITSSNQTDAMIKTAGGNLFEMADQSGQERIKLESPFNNSYLHLGYPFRDGDGITTMTHGLVREEHIGGYQSTLITKDRRGTLGSGSLDQYDERALHTFKKVVIDSTGGTVGQLGSELTSDEELSGNYIVERRNGERFTWSDGNDYTIGNGKVFSMGSSFTMTVVKDPTAADYNSFVTKMANVGSTVRCTDDSSNGWFGLSLEAASTAQDIIYGHSYNYTSGKSLAKYVGSYQEFFEAANTSVFWGVANEWHFGAASEYFLGIKNEINMGGIWETNIAIKMETSLAVLLTFAITRTQVDLQKTYMSTQATKVAAQNFNADLQNSEVNGSKLAAQLNKIETNASNIEANATAIETNATEIKANATAIENNATDIKNALTEIKSNATKIENAMTEIKSNATAIENASAKVETTSAEVAFLAFKSYM